MCREGSESLWLYCWTVDIQPRLSCLEEEVLVEAEEVRPAVGFGEGLVEGTHCQHPHPEEDSFSSLCREQLRYQQGGGRVS